MLIRSRFGVRLAELLFFFVCGVLIGTSIHIIAISNEAKMRTVQSTVENVSAAELFDKVKIFCFVVTRGGNRPWRTVHVKNTWVTRCNKYVFISDETDTAFGSVKIQENDTYHRLWSKTKRALVYVYEHHYDEFDWFYKSDDDTYAMIDNMRYFLAAYSTDDPIYFGKKFLLNDELLYFAGGSGYVLGKKALKKFVTEALPDETKCSRNERGNEDIQMGICMNNIGVYFGDTRDQFKRETFLPLQPQKHLTAEDSDWYFRRIFYSDDEGLDCCSKFTISFHYIQKDLMYLMEYLVNNFQAYGIRHVYGPLPGKVNFTIVAQTLRTEDFVPRPKWSSSGGMRKRIPVNNYY